jgi:hypothetical protein
LRLLQLLLRRERELLQVLLQEPERELLLRGQLREQRK